MRKHDELTNSDSCLNKAREDEWIFVLLERDPAAIEAVRVWINERIRLGLNALEDAKIQSAVQWIAEVLYAQGGSNRVLRSECTHGVVFDKEEADRLKLTPAQVQERWPRLNGPCPLNCGYVGIAYKSMAHFLYGDW